MNGKKLVRGTILTALCMAALLYGNGMTGKAFWVEVKSNETRVRNEASTESEVMTAVNAGDKLNVFSEVQDGAGNTWYLVAVNNASGYVRSDTVQETSEPVAEVVAATTEQPAATDQPAEPVSSSAVTSMASQAATIKKDDVNVRSEASTNGSVVAKLANGAAVTLTGSTTDGSGNTWYQVNFINNGSNVTGFIRSDFVEPGEVMEPQAPAEETPAEGEDPGLADMYGDMPAEGETANNDYELFFEPDAEGVDCWYIHDNVAQKRYKLEQLMKADEMNASNIAIKDKEISRMRIVLIVLAVLLVIALAAAAIFGFKYHDLKDDDDDDEDDDDEEDYRAASAARRRERAEAEPAVRRRETARGEERGARGAVRRSDAGAYGRTAGTQRRPEREEVRTARPGRTRTEGEMPKRQPSAAAPRTRTAEPMKQVRRTPAPSAQEPVRKSTRSDVEWKSKNFLAGDEDGLDFSFIDGDDED